MTKGKTTGRKTQRIVRTPATKCAHFANGWRNNGIPSFRRAAAAASDHQADNVCEQIAGSQRLPEALVQCLKSIGGAPGAVSSRLFAMYRNLRQCVDDLEATGQLRRVNALIDPNLEAAEIQRRVFRAGGPALLLTNVVGCRFPMLCNLFGTMERTRYIFRDSLDRLKQLVTLQVDPADLMRRPRLYLNAPGRRC